MSQSQFDGLYQRQLAYLRDKDFFVENCYAGADHKYQISIRVITETAWQNIFARNMLICEPDVQKQLSHCPAFTVICTTGFHANPKTDGTNSDAFIVLNIERGLIIIGETSYAGEIKKTVFSFMEYLLPKRGVLSTHSSANYGKDRDDVTGLKGLEEI